MIGISDQETDSIFMCIADENMDFEMHVSYFPDHVEARLDSVNSKNECHAIFKWNYCSNEYHAMFYSFPCSTRHTDSVFTRGNIDSMTLCFDSRQGNDCGFCCPGSCSFC